jgi:hypothetical protein
MTPQQKELYDIWRGIRYFWAPGGPADTGIMPAAHSGNAEEVLAFKLRQNSIRQHKAAIKRYLNCP